MATMMPRPTTTSAAATTITKNTIDWPPTSSSMRANVMNVRLTALSMSSTHMNMISTLRRTSSPTAPMVNSTAATDRYHAPGTLISPRPLELGVGFARLVVGGRVRPAHEHDGRHDGDHQQRRGDLEGQQVGAEQRPAELLHVRPRAGQLARRRLGPRRPHGRVDEPEELGQPEHPDQQGDRALGLQHVDDPLARPPHTEQHDHEQEQHDDGAGVHDHLNGEQELCGLLDEQHGHAEQRLDEEQRGVDGVAGGHDAEAAGQHDDRRDDEHGPVGRLRGGGEQHQWCPWPAWPPEPPWVPCSASTWLSATWLSSASASTGQSSSPTWPCSAARTP